MTCAHVGRTGRPIFFASDTDEKTQKCKHDGKQFILSLQTALYRLSVNRNHGLYQREVSYGTEKNLVVAEVYRTHVNANSQWRATEPLGSCSELPSSSQCCRSFWPSLHNLHH